MIPENSEVRFEVTTRCNYNCRICPRDRLRRKLETMSIDTFKMLIDKIMDETDQYRIVTFSGFGEPLLDNTITEKIAYARSKGLEVLMLTNASLLTVEKFKTFDELGVESIRVSFYGDSPEIYNKIHNIEKKELFVEVKSVLDEICGIKKNTKILMTYNVEKGVNESDMKRWIESWKGKADLLEIWTPHNWVNGKHYRKVQSEKKATCGRPWKTPLQMQVDGTVNMCCFDFNGELLLGDLKKESLKEIFNSEMIKKIRKHHTSGDFKGSGLICENCDQRNKDKKGVMLYNSKYDIDERVEEVSTTYSRVSLNDA